MADPKEFQTFFSLFVNLWKEGKEAKFPVRSKAAKAVIKLELALVNVLLPPVTYMVPGPASQVEPAYIIHT